MSSGGAEAPAAAAFAAANSTPSGSIAHWRPQRNASRLRSVATPFRSMADSNDAAVIGSAPHWKATPIRNTFAEVVFPKRRRVTAPASTQRFSAARELASTTDLRRSVLG